LVFLLLLLVSFWCNKLEEPCCWESQLVAPHSLLPFRSEGRERERELGKAEFMCAWVLLLVQTNNNKGLSV
jgi:hypothetical protein